MCIRVIFSYEFCKGKNHGGGQETGIFFFLGGGAGSPALLLVGGIPD